MTEQSWPSGIELETAVVDLPAYELTSAVAPGEWLGGVRVRRAPNPLPNMNVAAVTRLDGDPDEVIPRVRAWWAERGRDRFVWSVPDGRGLGPLVDRLLATGAVVDPAQPIGTAMLLDREPPRVETDVEIRPEATFEDFVARWELILASFDFEEADRVRVRARYAEDWELVRADAGRRSFLAWDGDRLVGFGGSLDTALPLIELGGAAVAPDARGRGIYRALIRARWDEAVARGKPRLGIHASKDARERLLPLGFRVLGTVRAYLDASGATAPPR